MGHSGGLRIAGTDVVEDTLDEWPQVSISILNTRSGWPSQIGCHYSPRARMDNKTAYKDYGF
jgi:hypothetical protein